MLKIFIFGFILETYLLWFYFVNCDEVIEADFQNPVVITTWKFVNATEKAWEILKNGGSALDAVEHGCAVCEEQQCDFTVGFGGSPDETGETTLDAMIMDGSTMNVGAVGGLRRIKNAIGVARRVLENTLHTFLVGDAAKNFAVEMGFSEEDLSTSYSKNLHSKWEQNKCQPNFRTRVMPDPASHCGPYIPASSLKKQLIYGFDIENHDTIGMIAIDVNLKTASGTSTNGAKFKIPGRVGDSPIAGAGSYVDDAIGGAAATGDGDIMMRFVPSFVAVDEMRRGREPTKAATIAIKRISQKYPNFMGGVIALRKDGEFGAACNGMDSFPFTVGSAKTGKVLIHHVKCKK